jgi:hypothetical protein
MILIITGLTVEMFAQSNFVWKGRAFMLSYAQQCCIRRDIPRIEDIEIDIAPNLRPYLVLNDVEK